MMKKIVFLASCLVFILGIPFAQARVDVSISIGVPPPLVFEAPPELVVVPYGSRYVYMVPDVLGVYFYGGFWYRIHDGYWFRARNYDGPWAYIVRGRVPRYIRNVPPDYYINLSPGYRRIPYGDLHRHWRSWDRQRYWNRQDWYRNEFREHQHRHRDRPAVFEGRRTPPRAHDRPAPRVERRPEPRRDGGPAHDRRGGKPREEDRRGGSGGDRFR